MNKRLFFFHAIIILAVFFSAEFLARFIAPKENFWYQEAEQYLESNTAQAIFIGSSRTEIGLLEEEFDSALQAHGIEHKTLNLGRGFSTHKMHYLGLRNLFENHPDALRNCVLFIEISENLPPVFINKDSWVFDVQPQLLLPVLRAADLPALWVSPTAFESKKTITLRYFFQYATLINKREYIREQFLSYGNNFTRAVFVKNHSEIQTATNQDALAEGTAVKTDDASIQFARELAYHFAKLDLKDQTPYGEFEDHEIYPIIKLAQGKGVPVVLVNLPLSSVQAEPLQTPLRVEEAKRFVETAQHWGTPIYSVEKSFTDEDFPDLWHLTPQAAQQFSLQLATRYSQEYSTINPPQHESNND